MCYETRKDHGICWNCWPSILLLSHEILVNPSSPLYMVRNIWIKKAKIANCFVRQKATCMPGLTPCSSKKIHEGRLKMKTKCCSSEHNTRREESKCQTFILHSSFVCRNFRRASHPKRETVMSIQTLLTKEVKREREREIKYETESEEIR